MPNSRPGGVLGRLVGIYLEHTPGSIQQLRSAVDAGDCAEAQRISHTLRSSSGMLGATSLAALLTEAEGFGRSAAHPELLRVTTAIEAEFERVQAALADLLSSPTNV